MRRTLGSAVMGTLDPQAHLADIPQVRALDDLMGRVGAHTLDVEMHGRDRPPQHLDEVIGWEMTLTFGTGDTVTMKADTAADAAYSLAVRLLNGGLCAGCDKIAVVIDDQTKIRPLPSTVVGLDGTRRTVTQQAVEREGICGWELSGDRWERWCGENAPEGSSRERLARALAGIYAHSQQIAHARRGRYDDNLSEHPFPTPLLIRELEPYGERAQALIERVKDGEFEPTPAEDRAYRNSPQGRAEADDLFRRLLPGLMAADRDDRRQR